MNFTSDLNEVLGLILGIECILTGHFPAVWPFETGSQIQEMSCHLLENAFLTEGQVSVASQVMCEWIEYMKQNKSKIPYFPFEIAALLARKIHIRFKEY